MITARKLLKNNGFTVEKFGHFSKNKHLSRNLKYCPHYLIWNKNKTFLIYFKRSYDNRFIELKRDEIESIRIWNSQVQMSLFFIYNEIMKKYTVCHIDEINHKMFSLCKREKIDLFLFLNTMFNWRSCNEKFDFTTLRRR